jgi:CubicO group peptidase (beta-lactamase class C family)
MAATHIPGAAVAIIQGDQIIYQRGFGGADDSGRAVTPDTPFIIGSLSKSFTAVAIMQLSEQGQIYLDAPVQLYLPWFRVADPDASKQITVRHLLNQTSGLNGRASDASEQFGQGPGAVEQNVRALGSTALTAPVGKEFQYSNVNYQVLGLLVEQASGERYADYIQTHIFDPLEMSHSYTSRTIAAQNGLAEGYRMLITGQPLLAFDHPFNEGALPSGSLISSANDMANYLIAQSTGSFRDHPFLTPDSLQLLHTPPGNIPDDPYAMGWITGGIADEPVILHGGSALGYSSSMLLTTKQGYGVVVVSNLYGVANSKRLETVAIGITHVLLGSEPFPPSENSRVRDGLFILAVLFMMQLLSIGFGWREFLRARRQTPLSRRITALVVGLAGLDLAICWVCLWFIPEMSESTLRTMFLFQPDAMLLLFLVTGISIVWGVVRTTAFALILANKQKLTPARIAQVSGT